MDTMLPQMKPFAPFIGTWKLSGRTYDSNEDNMSGNCTFSWLENGQLQQLSEIIFDGQKVKATEVIEYDETTGTFSSKVYGGEEPLSYTWSFEGDIVKHKGAGGTYTGRVSDDGNTISGTWRPDKGVASSQLNSYDMVMTRTQ